MTRLACRRQHAVPSPVLLTSVLLVFLSPVTGVAQSALESWSDPEMGNITPTANDNVTYYFKEKIDDQDADLKVIENSFSTNLPLFQNDHDEWVVSGKARYLRNVTDALLPDSGRPLAEDLWEVDMGTSYRHRFEHEWIRGWTGGVSVNVGSSSDEPFNSTDELIVHAAAMVRVPFRERHAWLFSLLYASDQEFLGGVPVPGIAFVYSPVESFNAVVGVPLTSISYKPTEKLSIDASYFPIRTVRTRIMYALFRPLRLFAGFDWDDDHYYLADREHHDDRLFYYDKRLSAGIRFDLRHVGIQVRGGYVFDRFYFVGDKYNDRHDDRVNIDSGFFITAGPSFRF